MLRSTAMVEDDLTTENPNPPHPLFTIYGRLLKGIASHTMYRSVLSALERALDRIETQLLDHLVVSSPFSDSWFSFVNVIEDRIEVKVHWDSHFVNICSYFDCPESDNCSDPERRWSICSACRIFYHCGRRCQIADWERHRIVCASMAKQRKMGHNVPLDTRTEMFLGWIIQRDIRVDRKKFLRAHEEYRAARQSSGFKPLASTIDDETLVTRLDSRLPNCTGGKYGHHR